MLDQIAKSSTLEGESNLVVEKHDPRSLPRDLQALASSKDKHVAVMHTLPRSWWDYVDRPVSIFTTPLEERGFVQAGPNAVGLIIQPRAHSWSDTVMRVLTNCSTVMNAWGHTALYVRIDGRIVRVTGFDPFKISRDVIGRGNAITTGRLKTPAHYNDDSGLFHNNTARVAEYALDRDDALRILDVMPIHGPAVRFPKMMQYYVGSAGDYLSKKEKSGETVAVVGNCVNYAIRTIQETLGADIMGFNDQDEEVGVLDLGGRCNANQGRLVKQFVYREKKSKKSLVLRFRMRSRGQIEPVVGSMPKSIIVIKGFKHAYMLASVARFSAPLMSRYVLPTSVSSLLPAAPYLLQTGFGAQCDTMAVMADAFRELSNQYISPRIVNALFTAMMLIGTAFLVFGDGEVEIVYGLWSMVWPYLLEVLCAQLA